MATSSYKETKTLIFILGILVISLLGAIFNQRNFSKTTETDNALDKPLVEIIDEVKQSVLLVVEGNPAERVTSRAVVGTAFVIKPHIVVTANHVVVGKVEDYLLLDSEGKSYQIDRGIRDAENDILYFEVTSLDKTLLKLNDELSSVGESVVALGSMMGEESLSATSGIISATNKSTQEKGISLNNLYQTDASLFPGMSGGPVINSRGEVVGMTIAVIETSENIGYLMPSSRINRGSSVILD